MKARHRLIAPVPLILVLLALLVAGFRCGTDVTGPPSGEEPGTYTKLPVLMIHGLNGSSNNFDTIKSHLIEEGYPADLLFTIDLIPNNTACDPGHVEQIHNKVEEIVSKTGFNETDLIAHSNGGTDAMNYMRYDNGVQRVRNWISIGGANNFECSERFPKTPPSDRTPGSQVLYTSIYSTSDHIVSNNASNLSGGRNIAVPDVSHIDLLFDEGVFEYILEGLQGEGANNN